ncbi:MAG: radical SAM protein [Schleiferiaceae bacterium]|nr:radical SAM protein [Schleiferiaceae bacterium]
MDWKIWLGNQARRFPPLQYSIRKTQGLQYQLLYAKNYRYTPTPNVHLKELHIEPVNYCNLRCKFCALDHAMPKERISIAVLERFFANYFEDKRFHGLQWIHLHNGGESLLHPKLIEVLEYIASQRNKAKAINVPFPKVALLTNATILTEERSEKIIATKAIDLMRFSVDGGTPELFEQIRFRAKWDTVKANIENFVARNATQPTPIATGIICLVPQHLPLHTRAMAPDFQQLLQLVDDVELRRIHGWAGDLQTESEETPDYLPEKTGCMMALESLVLLPDGSVTICCADLNRKGIIGNLMKQTLFEIYTAPQRLEVLEKLHSGRKAEIPLCKDCESF